MTEERRPGKSELRIPHFAFIIGPARFPLAPSYPRTPTRFLTSACCLLSGPTHFVLSVVGSTFSTQPFASRPLFSAPSARGSRLYVPIPHSQLDLSSASRLLPAALLPAASCPKGSPPVPVALGLPATYNVVASSGCRRGYPQSQATSHLEAGQRSYSFPKASGAWSSGGNRHT